MPSALEMMPSRTPVSASARSPSRAPGSSRVPEGSVGELAVEMVVHVGAQLVGRAALGDVRVEVRVPLRGPVELRSAVEREH